MNTQNSRKNLTKPVTPQPLRLKEYFLPIGRKVPGKNFTGYFVSQYGTVQDRRTDNHQICGTSRLKEGYIYCKMTDIDTGKSRLVAVHQLVCFVFHGSTYSSEKNQVDHIGGVKDNNHRDNLRFVSPGENNRHASMM
ncbi:uncharacterized protein BX664DRAFT_122331 [Halteromyces radiatus]|uniref:uncharacterized protein n=1 Tax=Halteromyces radiatus TaxID=101107 RepID=UPI00221F2E9C|nr:uncharacterized protein BX664DRAFT_122331 [Halteromyces radiatus]KAI8088848.1 hypothetical protein BX664DRAFT_122331 [Halteromyces radiatus]